MDSKFAIFWRWYFLHSRGGNGLSATKRRQRRCRLRVYVWLDQKHVKFLYLFRDTWAAQSIPMTPRLAYKTSTVGVLSFARRERMEMRLLPMLESEFYRCSLTEETVGVASPLIANSSCPFQVSIRPQACEMFFGNVADGNHVCNLDQY